MATSYFCSPYCRRAHSKRVKTFAALLPCYSSLYTWVQLGRDTQNVCVGRTNQVGQVIFMLLIAKSFEQAWAMLLDHKNKKWNLQKHECSRCALASILQSGIADTQLQRLCGLQILQIHVKTSRYLWPKKTQAHTTSDSLALILEFKNLFFFSLWIKFLFHWSQQTPFDFDKAKISFEVFCFLLTCVCVWRFILSSKPFLRVTWNCPSFPAVWAPHWLEDYSQTDKECLLHDR